MRVVLLAGFTQTPASWTGVIQHLGEDFEPVALPLPVGRNWTDTTNSLASDGGAGTWVGYSLGGRLALQVALDHPDLVPHLVLVSATAGISDPAEREQRRAEDESRALSIESQGVDHFLDRWLAQPMFAQIPPDAPGLGERRSNDAAALSAALRDLGVASMPDLWPRLGELRMRVTIVAGTQDNKFLAIADRLEAGCANADVRRVEVDSGHAVPLERPDFLRALL